MPFHFTRRAAIATSAAALLVRPVLAQEPVMHEVQMLNVDPDDPRARQVYIPRILVAQPGDTVKFVSVDRGHNSESVPEMMPDGAENWEGAINDDIEVTVSVPGFYGYKCTPHASVGMVGLIIVQGDGMMDNREAAQGVRQRGRARQVWDEIWEEVDGMDLA
ncbi:pseudoazurin [Cognatiyoonia sp. IB215182]|uniref:pseudoazurin n=1 Tax=Cognatiyoonia sp. IB215182 TaxID=3097353 RepID=UPI002A103951|nr:pseudoazurin [Cognatiyoonia sp. IB215182]MDX8354756.1 pseudoazurin [Cognatiyoonia sp. IB215182]